MPLETGILTTKLCRPRISGDLVPRPRLLQHLEERRGRPLTLVSAPAGYGKTTLVSSWLEACDCPSAWLSLDEGDDDLVLCLEQRLSAGHRETTQLQHLPEARRQDSLASRHRSDRPRNPALQFKMGVLPQGRSARG